MSMGGEVHIGRITILGEAECIIVSACTIEMPASLHEGGWGSGCNPGGWSTLRVSVFIPRKMKMHLHFPQASPPSVVVCLPAR